MPEELTVIYLKPQNVKTEKITSGLWAYGSVSFPNTVYRDNKKEVII